MIRNDKENYPKLSNRLSLRSNNNSKANLLENIKIKNKISLNKSNSILADISLSSKEHPKINQIDIQRVPTLIDRIFEYLKESSDLNIPIHGYMAIQNDINEKMRGILNDWLVDVHLKFKLLPETLFLTFNLIDRYLEIETINRNKLQCLGVSCMLIASKYEEIYPPEVRDFAYITDHAYTKQDILDMEKQILKALDYEVLHVSSLRYLEVLNEKLRLSDEAFTFAKFLIELMQIDYNNLKIKPYNLAVSTYYITIKKYKEYESADLYKLVDLDENIIKEIAKKMIIKVEEMKSKSLQAVFRKFSSSSNYSVSKQI